MQRKLNCPKERIVLEIDGEQRPLSPGRNDLLVGVLNLRPRALEILLSASMLRINAKRLFKVINCLSEISLHGEHEAKIVVGVGIFGIDAKCLLKMDRGRD